MTEDQLTRAERVRLESLAQASHITGAAMGRQVPLTKVFEVAKEVEKFLLAADQEQKNG